MIPFVDTQKAPSPTGAQGEPGCEHRRDPVGVEDVGGGEPLKEMHLFLRAGLQPSCRPPPIWR